MKKLLILLSGLPGSGKSTAAKFFQSKGIPVLRLGLLTEKILKKEKKKINEESESQIRLKIRQKKGKDIYAKSIKSKVKSLFGKGNNIIIIEGLMSLSEAKYFDTINKNNQIIFIKSKKSLRFERLIKRKIRPLNHIEIVKRDKQELNIFGLNKIEIIADYKINNNLKLNNFYFELNRIYLHIKKNDYI